MQSFASVLFTLLGLTTLLPSVTAHGFVSRVTIDGKAYQGNVPNNFKCKPQTFSPKYNAEHYLQPLHQFVLLTRWAL